MSLLEKEINNLFDFLYQERALSDYLQELRRRGINSKQSLINLFTSSPGFVNTPINKRLILLGFSFPWVTSQKGFDYWEKIDEKFRRSNNSQFLITNNIVYN